MERRKRTIDTTPCGRRMSPGLRLMADIVATVQCVAIILTGKVILSECGFLPSILLSLQKLFLLSPSLPSHHINFHSCGLLLLPSLRPPRHSAHFNPLLLGSTIPFPFSSFRSDRQPHFFHCVVFVAAVVILSRIQKLSSQSELIPPSSSFLLHSPPRPSSHCDYSRRYCRASSFSPQLRPTMHFHSLSRSNALSAAD